MLETENNQGGKRKKPSCVYISAGYVHETLYMYMPRLFIQLSHIHPPGWEGGKHIHKYSYKF